MGKVAFLFAGQGAQYVGMGEDLYHNSPAAKRVFDMAEALRPGTIAMCFAGPKEQLNDTIHTQPCLYTMNLACAEAAKEAGVVPAGVAGFSLGELSAAAFAGMYSYADGFLAVCERAKLMAQAAVQNPGSMVAVLRLEATKVEEIAATFSHAYPVNYNCSTQTVVAIEQSEKEAFINAVKEAGGRAMPLAVSGAFHSPFMESAAEGFLAYIKGVEMKAPTMPLYSNVNALPYNGEADIKKQLSAQIKSPVLWQQTIETMQQDGFDTFVEVGAGKTLTGLLGKIGGAEVALHVQDAESLAAAKELL